MSQSKLNLSSLSSEISILARRAGTAILEIYATDFSFNSKADSSPVTVADTAAEEIITRGLQTLTPNIPIVAEEAASAGYLPDISGGTFWLVDPLDGTREFLKRNGEFTVNIGLVHERVPVLGVVYAPTFNDLYSGGEQMGAIRISGKSAPSAIRVRKIPMSGVTVVASRHHNSQEEANDLVNGRSVAERKTTGSSIKFCLVAAGEADFYPRHGRTMEWDTAAGHAILSAAGGRIVTTGGKPLLYGKPGFENPTFVAMGSE